jgi:hypothetical protein
MMRITRYGARTSGRSPWGGDTARRRFIGGGRGPLLSRRCKTKMLASVLLRASSPKLWQLLSKPYAAPGRGLTSAHLQYYHSSCANERTEHAAGQSLFTALYCQSLYTCAQRCPAHNDSPRRSRGSKRGHGRAQHRAVALVRPRRSGAASAIVAFTRRWRPGRRLTSQPTQSRRCASRTTRSASPRRATKPARTCCRSSSGSTSTASTSRRSNMATAALVRLCIYVPGTFYCNPS